MHDILRVCICVWNDFGCTKSCLRKIIVYEGLNCITNINHGFLKLQVLMLIYAAISLAGLHILNHLQNLILDKNTIYSTLLNFFPKLNQELNSSSPKDILTLNKVWGYSRKWGACIWFFKRNGKKWHKKCWNRAKNGEKKWKFRQKCTILENILKTGKWLCEYIARIKLLEKALSVFNFSKSKPFKNALLNLKLSQNFINFTQEYS